MKLLGAFVIGAVLVAAGYAQKTDDKTTVEPLVKVADTKADLTRVDAPDDSYHIYVDRNKINEIELDGEFYRKAWVVYAFPNPTVDVKGKKVHYMLSEVMYHCKSKAYVTMSFTLFGEDAQPIYNHDKEGEVEIAESSNPLAEVNYVCGQKNVSKTKPEDSVKKSSKSQKFVDI